LWRGILGALKRGVFLGKIEGGAPRGGGGDGSSQTAHIQRMKDSLLCRDTVSVNLSEYILLVNRCLHD